MFAFFYSLGNNSVSRQFLKIRCNGFDIVEAQSFIMLIEISKKVLKKLILDASQKTAFTFNDIIYEQKDGVSMGASLRLVLANINMTEC